MNFRISKFAIPNGMIDPNYFDLPTNTVAEDYIIINKFPKEKIPTFREELSKTTDPLNFQAGEISLELSWLDTGTKSNLGKTVKEFFDISAMKIFRVIISFTEPATYRLVYFVDVEKLFMDKHPLTGKITKIVMQSAEKELTDCMSTKPVGALNDDIDNGFEYFLLHILFRVNCGLIDDAHVSDIVNSVYGFRPKTSRLVVHFNQQNCWHFFKSLILNSGVMFRVVGEPSPPIYLTGTMYVRIFWRFNGLVLNVVKTMEHGQGIELSKDVGYLMPTAKFRHEIPNHPEFPVFKGYEGFVRSPANNDIGMQNPVFLNNADNYDNPLFPKDSYTYRIGFSQNGDERLLGHKEKVRVMESHRVWVSGNFRWKNPAWFDDSYTQYEEVSPIRCLVRSFTWTPNIPPATGGTYTDEGFDLMMKAIITSNVYDFLISQFVKTIYLKPRVESGFVPIAYSILSFLSKTYWVESMSDYDPFHKEITAKGWEINA